METGCKDGMPAKKISNPSDVFSPSKHCNIGVSSGEDKFAVYR